MPAASFVPAATIANERIYVDPEGWYSVNLPADWQSVDSPNSFKGEDGFFQTGYLPQMMFMWRDLNVCQWLANIDTKDTYSVSWSGTRRNSCQLNSLPEVTPATVVEVIENPSADYPQRYLCIKADAEHFARIANTFVWLKPVNEDARPAYHTASLRSDDIAFWEKTIPLPEGISLAEYELPAEVQNEDPGEKIFLDFIPPQARPKPRAPSHQYSSPSLENFNETSRLFGYELRSGTEAYLYDLYRGEMLALSNIYKLPVAYRFPAPEGEKLVFLAHTVKDPAQPFYTPGNGASYLVQNDSITLWEDQPPSPMDPGVSPIQVAGEILLLGLGDHRDVQVRNSQHRLLYSFATYFGTHIPVRGFHSWDNHWVLEVSDFLAQDGESVNGKFGFEEVFDWFLLDGKPLYFFRKGPRVGISYDGKFFPMYYNEIMHGYCCGLAINNPATYENTVRFFGRRDGIWHYVVLEIH